MVKSAQRVATALQFLANNPSGSSYSDLQRSLDLPKSSLHALLDTLVQTKLASFDKAAKRYALGPLVWELAVAFSNQLQIVPLALPHLERLGATFGETVQLAILDHTEVVYVAKTASRHPIQLVSNVGTRLPAYATGLGKALLACLSEEQIERLYPNPVLERFTPDTLTTISQLSEELETTRLRGYATDRGEYSSGINCIAVPIVTAANVPKAAISISIPVQRYGQYDEQTLVEALVSEAYTVARKLGALSPDSWRHQASSSL